LRARGGQVAELQNAKRPTDYRDSGASPFFEGDRSLKQNTKKGDVCAANNHRQKNGGLERTYTRVGFLDQRLALQDYRDANPNDGVTKCDRFDLLFPRGSHVKFDKLFHISFKQQTGV